jgi:probable F420-dependent oxidoreductase
LRRAGQLIEELGYGAIWFGEGLGREAFTHASILLGATRRIAVGTGIANIFGRDPVTMLNGARTLAEAWPDRFVLGMGVSHAKLVTARGHAYAQPVTAMASYLDAMEAAPAYTAVAPRSSPPIVLAGLGPRMLALAAERTSGALMFFVDTTYIKRAREIVGPDPFLGLISLVAVRSTRRESRSIGDRHTRSHIEMPNYRRNLLRMGWTDEDLVDAGSDALFDAIVPWGQPERIAERVGAQYSAGADHVAVNVVSPTQDRLPEKELALIAQHLLN